MYSTPDRGDVVQHCLAIIEDLRILDVSVIDHQKIVNTERFARALLHADPDAISAGWLCQLLDLVESLRDELPHCEVCDHRAKLNRIAIRIHHVIKGAIL